VSEILDPEPVPPTSVAELAALAVGLCQDAAIGLEVAPDGWSFDPVRRVIRVSGHGLRTRGPEYCAGIVAHEVGHYYISRYTSLPTAFPSIRAGRSLLNAIEDPRVDRWIVRRYPGAIAWQELAKVDEIAHGPSPTWFLMFCLECAAEGDRDWRPARQVLPEPVKTALSRTRDARRTYAHHAPPTDPDAPLDDDLARRYREEVWPLLTDVRWVPPRREQRVQLSALEALRIAEQAIFPAAAALYHRDVRTIGAWLCAHPANAGRGRRLHGEGRGGEAVAEAMAAGLPDRLLPPWAEGLAEQLLDGEIDRRVSAPMVVAGGMRRRRGRPSDRRVKYPPLPPIWSPATDYDRAYAEVSDQVEALVHHLDEILRPRKRLRERSGHPNGRRVDLRRLMAFEADPRRYDELWVRASIPDRREAAIGLLVDLSGSMQGAKARAALLGTVLVAETLARLQVPFRIDGFQDVLIELHGFNEPLGPASRQKIAEMVQEVQGCREGGNNNPRYNDDAPCLLEHAEKLSEYPATDRILIVVSDGLPEGRRSASSDLHAAVATLSDPAAGLRLVALGLGPDTEHVKTFYPESQANVALPRFADTIGTLIENVLVVHP
jgi:Cobalamin biosynthesis protein CobT VWA domain